MAADVVCRRNHGGHRPPYANCCLSSVAALWKADPQHLNLGLCFVANRKAGPRSRFYLREMPWSKVALATSIAALTSLPVGIMAASAHPGSYVVVLIFATPVLSVAWILMAGLAIAFDRQRKLTLLASLAIFMFWPAVGVFLWFSLQQCMDERKIALQAYTELQPAPSVQGQRHYGHHKHQFGCLEF